MKPIIGAFVLHDSTVIFHLIAKPHNIRSECVARLYQEHDQAREALNLLFTMDKVL